MSIIRPGNSYTEPITSIVDGDEQPFPLNDTTTVLTVADARGDTVLTHTLVVNALGNIVTSDGLAPQSTVAAGVVVNTLSAAETTALAEGWYHWIMEFTDTSGNTWEVDSGAWEVKAQQTYRVAHGTTRREIRRRILSRLGDFLLVTATEDGSTTTLIDRIHLIGEPDAYRGRQIMFTGGTVENLGQERFITGSARTNRSITMDYDLPEATALGDQAEIVNFRGTGYKFAEVDIALDAAVDDAADMAPEPVTLDVADLYNKDLGGITIPDDWVAVSAVDWREADDQPWQHLEHEGRRLSSGWGLDRSRRIITISGERSRYIHERAVRIYGMRKPSPIPFDDDVTGINPEWLVARSVANLSSAAYRRNPTTERRDMLGYDIENERMVRTRVTKRSAGVLRL